jgi:hypothetical protein
MVEDEDSELSAHQEAEKNEKTRKALMSLSIDGRFKVLFDMILHVEKQMNSDIDELWDAKIHVDQHNELIKFANVTAERVNWLYERRGNGKVPDQKAFRKHLNQGYAMLKRLEEEERAGKPSDQSA